MKSLVELMRMRSIFTAWVLLSSVLASPAGAQGTHDADQRWIRQTIHQQHRKEWFDARRHIRPRHSHRQRVETHPSTRVYGVIMRGPQQVYRDATSHVQCWPPYKHVGGEFSDEKRAWNEAQLGWMGAVSAEYGSRYADVQNVDARTLHRQCFRVSFNDSWAARNLEAAQQAVGLTGYKVRCIIVASPCMAPATNSTPLKGDER